MAFIPANKQWQVRYRGKLYARSCRQLGLPKEQWNEKDSLSAFTAWWEGYRKQLDGEPAEPDTVQLPDVDLGYAVMTDFRIPKKRSDEIVKAVMALIDPPKQERTTKANVEAWLAFLQTKEDAGQIAEARTNAYRSSIKPFENFAPDTIDQINSETVRGFHKVCLGKIEKGEWKASHAKGVFGTTKQFIQWLAVDKEAIDLPKAILSRNLQIRGSLGEITTWKIAEIRSFLALTKEKDKSLHLWTLLMLNCGMLGKDVSDLTTEEVNLEKGTINRYRSKIKNRADANLAKARKVTYRLWDETANALREYMTNHKPMKDGRVFQTEDGNALIHGKRTDNIRLHFNYVTRATKTEPAKEYPPMSKLRNTARSLLDRHPTYGRYGKHFLGHSPRSVDDRHYNKPDRKQFFRACRWLGRKILGSNTK